MKHTLNFTDFLGFFSESNTYRDAFTFEGKKTLFNYLIQCEAESGEELEIDVVALACGHSEYKNLAEFQTEYGEDYKSLEDIAEATTVIKFADYLDDAKDDERFLIVSF